MWCAAAVGCGGSEVDEQMLEDHVGTTRQALCSFETPLPRVGASASSAESAKYPASAAIDGNLATRWSSVFADPQWLVVDLGAPRWVKRVNLRWEAAASRSYGVELANDAAGPWVRYFAEAHGDGGVDAVDLGATGRFLRIFSSERTTTFGVSLFEVEAFGDLDGNCNGTVTPPSPPCGSSKLTPVAARASSLESAAYPASEAIDGILQATCGAGNRWSSAARDPQWLQLDLGSVRHVSRVVLNWECAASANYDVQVATDASGPWATVSSDAAANGGRDDIAGLNATGRYVRVLSYARRTAFGNSLYEVEVYGDENAACGADTCANPSASNATSLVLRDPNIGARFGSTTTARGAVRMAQNPVSKRIYVLLGDGSLRELSLATLTTSPAVAASTILSQLPPGTFLSSVQGLAFGPEGNAYLVGNEDHGSTNVGVVVKGTFDRVNDGWTWSLLARSAPYPDSNTPFDHHWNGVVVSPDGQYVYVNSGSRTDHGEVQDVGGAFPDAREVALTSRLFRLPTSGSNILLPNDEQAVSSYVFARGLRNTFDPAFSVDGRLVGADNGPDSDYNEELNWLRAGQHYGFPWRLGNENNAMQFADYNPLQDFRLHPEYSGYDYYYNDPAFPPQPPGLIDPIVNRGPDADQYRDVEQAFSRDASLFGRTLSTFTAHRSPLGLSFDVAGRLCGPLKNGALLLSFGAAVPATPSNNMLPDQGRDLLALKVIPVENSFEVESRQLVSGFANPIDSVLIGSKLYVLEYGGTGTSRVYELSLPESG